MNEIKIDPSKSIANLRPNLQKEWHPTKNGTLTPYDVTLGSNKKVWWVCKKGHEWEASIYKRASNRGCPYCSGQKVSNDNCLATKNPDIAKEWHPTKNGDLTPYDVTPKSDKKVWWICSKEHEWEAQVKHRSNGTGCPYCNHKLATVETSLAAANPALAAEWHPTNNYPLIPEDVLPNSNKTFWWKCNKGHEWKASLNNRNKGRNCPFCGNKQVCIDNCLATVDPLLAAQWHPTKNGDLQPNEVLPFSNTYAWWRCELGHEWESKISNRSNGRECPHCNPKGTSREEQLFFNEFKTIFSSTKNKYKPNKQRQFEADIFIPDLSLDIEYDGSEWHKQEEMKKRDLEKNKTFNELGIFVMRIREQPLELLTSYDVSYNYQKYERFQVMKQILSFILTNLSEKLTKKQAEKIEQYLQNESYVPVFKHSKANLIKQNSLAEKYPELAKEWSQEKNGDLKPYMIAPNYNRKVWWRCSKFPEHVWEAKPNNRVQGKKGCPYCSGNLVSEQNSLKNMHLELSNEWHPTKNKKTPSDYTAGSNQKVWWICEKGHEWEAVIHSRSQRGVGCPYCAGKKADELNCLATLHPDIVSYWHPSNSKTPYELTPGSDYKAHWICKNGHEWDLTIYNQLKRKNICVLCNKPN